MANATRMRSGQALTLPTPQVSLPDVHLRSRSDFVRDVLKLQVKLLVGSLLGLVLGPATLVAAFLDLVFKSGSHGSRFYRVLDWGRRGEKALGLYAALEARYETIEPELDINFPEGTS